MKLRYSRAQATEFCLTIAALQWAASIPSTGGVVDPRERMRGSRQIAPPSGHVSGGSFRFVPPRPFPSDDARPAQTAPYRVSPKGRVAWYRLASAGRHNRSALPHPHTTSAVPPHWRWHPCDVDLHRPRRLILSATPAAPPRLFPPLPFRRSARGHFPSRPSTGSRRALGACAVHSFPLLPPPLATSSAHPSSTALTAGGLFPVAAVVGAAAAAGAAAGAAAAAAGGAAAAPGAAAVAAVAVAAIAGTP